MSERVENSRFNSSMAHSSSDVNGFGSHSSRNSDIFTFVVVSLFATTKIKNKTLENKMKNKVKIESTVRSNGHIQIESILFNRICYE